MQRVIVSVTVGALLLAGCTTSSAGLHTTAGTTTTTSTTGPGVAHTTTAPPPLAPATASDLLAKLRAAKLPIAHIAVVTAAGDGNHLLGRPGGYTSKVTFTDSRIDPGAAADSSAGSVDLGGAVETYPSSAGAAARAAYIQATLRANPALGTEYDYVIGSSVLRLSSALTPDQAAAYRSAA